MNHSAGSPARLVLERSRPLRLFTLFILYVGQGMPIGLFWFAVPAWMAVNGASAADIGTVAAWTALPWSLKLVNGFFMDRYTYLPMGRRRLWIIAAQMTMVAALLTAALVDPGARDTAILAAIGFAVNVATTFQDVAVDGLAVDIMSEDERARGSGMMFGGQSIGIAGATAMAGLVIERFGAPAAFALVAALMFALGSYVTLFREREGERLMPWTQGEALERNRAIQLEAWWPLLRTTFASLMKPVSVLFVPVLFMQGFFYGGMVGVTPLIGANAAGLDTATIASLNATASLVAGVLAMTLGGWLGDRYGAKRIVILWLAGELVLAAAMFAGQHLWGVSGVFVGFITAWIALDLLLTVAYLPIAMRLCAPSVAATQFTIYMALSNLGISAGAAVLGQADALGGLAMVFPVIGAGSVLALALMLTVKFPRRPEYYARQAAAAKVFDSSAPVPADGGAA
ncbi:MFS transporter [Erythrobacter sp. NE805]|uniref:MFS transporter n=1 Tax=Erythrobacter sp. NE805 TaxID=3389875 RepID=UPI00396B1F25